MPKPKPARAERPAQPLGVVLPAKQIPKRSAIQQELDRLTEPPLLESLPLFHHLVVLGILRLIEIEEERKKP